MTETKQNTSPSIASQLMVPQLATATLETVINKLIDDQPENARQLAQLKGQVLQLDIKELNSQFTFVFSQKVDVLANYEGEVDCLLSLHLSVLPQLKEQNNITALIKQEKIDLQGDIKLAQKFAQLMENSKPDIEEWLSRVMGDIAAHTLMQGVKGMGGWLKNKAGTQRSHLSQVITQEWRIAPGSLEVANFCDQVAEVECQLEGVEQRINQLTGRL